LSIASGLNKSISLKREIKIALLGWRWDGPEAWQQSGINAYRAVEENLNQFNFTYRRANSAVAGMDKSWLLLAQVGTSLMLASSFLEMSPFCCIAFLST